MAGIRICAQRATMVVVATAVVMCVAVGRAALRPQQPPQPARQAAQPPQQPPEPSQQPPIRVGTELVRVDVSVIGRNGQPITDLAQDDFEVFEDDRPQPIQSFKFVALNGHPAEDDELSLPIRSRDHARAEAAKDEVRVFLIFWDEYHISRMNGALRAREDLMEFVRTAFGPTDLVAFMDPLTTLDSIRFTRDRLELAETVRTLRGRQGEYIPPRSLVEEAQLQLARNIEQVRSEVTVSALKAATVFLGAIRQGRKAIILVSQGMRGLGRDEPTILSDLIRTANDNNTAFYAINPLGLTMRRSRSFEMLEALAAGTGGDFFSTNDLGQSFRQVVTRSSALYLLGYAPDERPFDGKFHKIRVRVKRPGVLVRARTGYWAPTVGDMTRAAKVAAEAALPPVVERGFAGLVPSSARRSIDVWAGTALNADGVPEVRLSWTPREGAEATAASAKMVATRGEEKLFEGEVGAGGATFTASPGPVQIVTTASDAAGELIDRDARTVDVPDPSASPLWFGSPRVHRTRNAREFKELAASPDAAPFPGRDFAKSDRLLIRFSAYGSAAADATITAQLLNRTGKPVAPLPVTRSASGYEIDLPLTTIARGEFLVLIEGTSGDERVEVALPVRIVR